MSVSKFLLFLKIQLYWIRAHPKKSSFQFSYLCEDLISK